MKSALRVTFALLCGVPFLMVLGNSMLFPIFPKMQQATGISEFQTSLIVTAFSVPAGLLIPVAGYLSDRFGRKAVMAPAVAIFAVGALVCALSASFVPKPFAFIMIGRVIEGIGAAGMAQLAMAMTADIFQDKKRSKMLGTLEASNGFGKVFSPIAGALAGLVVWYLPFYVFGVLAIPESMGLFFMAKEPQRERSKGSFSDYLGKVKQVFGTKGKSLGVVLIGGLVAMFILFGTLFYLSEVLEKRYGMKELSVGFTLALPVAALSLTSFLVGMYLQKRQTQAKLSVWLGLLVVAAVMVVLSVWDQRTTMMAAISFMGIGGGLILPSLTLLITSSVAPAQRGMITSLYGGVRFFGVALGPPIFGLLMKSGNGILFGAAAALTVATAVGSMIWIKPQKMLSGGGGSAGGQGGGRDQGRDGGLKSKPKGKQRLGA